MSMMSNGVVHALYERPVSYREEVEKVLSRRVIIRPVGRPGEIRK